ncbi:MAG: sugar ABC transporter ATP-binding protein [Treponema sp.]|jgi:simple sugar transport system ATP-binding protein|nr:sugar ABC transporter ATP-binding protein [Treponema sp.]
MEENSFLRLENVSKSFYGTTVLSGVSFSVRAGEIVGLVGENGAGKTTLMHILFGMPDIISSGGYEGALYLNGEKVFFKSPFDALDAGIALVHQEFSLIPGFNAAENISLNREASTQNIGSFIFGKRLETLQHEQIIQKAVHAIAKLNVSIDPRIIVSEMPVGHKQFTEIAREISREQVKLLVLDEPTAVLTESEAEILLSAIKKLASEGIAIIFISHRLHEIVALADRIVVLRDGNIIKDIENRSVSVQDIATWMVGRTVGESKRRSTAREFGDDLLKVEHLWVDMPGETVRNVSFSVRKGEIFGIGGLAGQGKLGIPNGIMGLCAAGGLVLLDGQPIPLENPSASLNTGMAFVSEDRRGVGLLLDESLYWNIAFGAMQVHGAYLKAYCGGLFKLRDEKAMRAVAQEYINNLAIKCTGPHQTAKELSGGNQQKICLARAFALQPRLLLVSEPTRGIDVGAKKIVLDTLAAYNHKAGTTIIMISSELEELRSMCDRIAIVTEGAIAGILEPASSPAEFGLLMAGSPPAGTSSAACT